MNFELLKQDLYFFGKVKKPKVRDHEKKHFFFLQHEQKIKTRAENAKMSGIFLFHFFDPVK